MFKRAVLAIAILGMVSTPAMADMVVPVPKTLAPINAMPNPVRSDTTAHVLQFGVVTGGGNLSQSYSITQTTGSIQLTFGFIWPYANPIQFVYPGYTATGIFGAMGAGFRVFWDQNELTPTAMGGVPGEGIRPGALLTAFNYTSGLPAGTLLAGFEGGATTTIGVGLFANRVNPGTHINTLLSTPVSAIIPGALVKFLQMTFAVDTGNVNGDGLLDLFITGRVSGRLFNIITTTGPFGTVNTFTVDTTALGTGFIWTQGGGGPAGVSVTPEPASMALFGAGCLALVGGFWRRKRRLS